MKKTRRKKTSSLPLYLPFRNRERRAGLGLTSGKQAEEINVLAGAPSLLCPHTPLGIY